MNQQKEIDLMELLFFVLRKWRVLLVAALIFAVLIGGYKGFSAAQNSETGLDKTQNELIEISENDIAQIEADIASEEKYRSNSIWYNIDSNNTAASKKVFYISTENSLSDEKESDFLGSVLKAYKNVLSGDDVISYISKKESLDPKYVREIVNINISEGENDAGSILTIFVYHNSIEDANRIMGEIEDQFGSVSKKVKESIGKHYIKEIESDSFVHVNASILSSKSNHDSRLSTLQSNLSSKQSELQTLQAGGSSETVSVPRTVIKFFIVGFAFGIFVFSVYYVIVFLGSNKLNRGINIKRDFSVRVLGKFNKKNSESKNNKIDAFLRKMENMGQTLDFESEMNVVAENVKNYSFDQKKILVTGMADRDRLALVAEKLQLILPEKTVLCGGFFGTDAESLKMIAQSESVLLVEECQVSTGTGIEAEIEKIRDLEKNLIGCVVFE